MLEADPQARFGIISRIAFFLRMHLDAWKADTSKQPVVIETGTIDEHINVPKGSFSRYLSEIMALEPRLTVSSSPFVLPWEEIDLMLSAIGRHLDANPYFRQATSAMSSLFSALPQLIRQSVMEESSHSRSDTFMPEHVPGSVHSWFEVSEFFRLNASFHDVLEHLLEFEGSQDRAFHEIYRLFPSVMLTLKDMKHHVRDLLLYIEASRTHIRDASKITTELLRLQGVVASLLTRKPVARQDVEAMARFTKGLYAEMIANW